jgi:hypothetical protein
MIEYYTEHVADRDIIKVDEGKRAAIMARDLASWNRKVHFVCRRLIVVIIEHAFEQAVYYNRLGIIFAGYMLSGDPGDGRAITQNSFFGPPHIASAFVEKHKDLVGHFADIAHDA